MISYHENILRLLSLPLWRWCGCTAPKTPIFSAAVTQCPHIFANCLCCHPKTPHFLVKHGPFNRSHPKTPYFMHLAATGSYFLFQLHRQVGYFCHFWRFLCVQIPTYKGLTERSKVTFSPNAPNFEPELWLLTQWPLILWDLCSHRMLQPMEVWALLYTHIHLILECPRAISASWKMFLTSK